LGRLIPIIRPSLGFMYHLRTVRETTPVFRLGTTAERSGGQTTPKRQCVTPHSGPSRHERWRRYAQPGQSQSRLRRQ